MHADGKPGRVTAASAGIVRPAAQFNAKGHEQAVALLKKEKTSDNDARISELAATALPIIEGHLIMAKRLDGIVAGGS